MIHWNTHTADWKFAEQRGWTDFYHVSPRTNRESIQNLGLRGEDGQSPWGDPWSRQQPQGNYFFTNPQDAENYAWVLKNQAQGSDPYEEMAYEYPEPPQGYWDWPEERQQEWDDSAEPIERTEDPNGYDVWRVNTRGLPIHRDPEMSIVQDHPYTPETLREEYRDQDWPEGQTGDTDAWQQQLNDHVRNWGQTPQRFYTPKAVDPSRVQLHRHYPRWDMTEDQMNNHLEEPKYTEQEVPVSWDEMLLRRPQFPAHSSWKFADYYHGAPTVERDRILQHGLQPGNPQLNGRWLLEDAGFSPEDAMMQNHHRTTDPSVFMTTEPGDAYMGRPGENDVWRIDPSYLNEEELRSDPLWQNARISPKPVPPEALSLHTPAEDAIWDLHQAAWGKTADAADVFNPVAPIDELTNFLNRGTGNPIGQLNPNNPLSPDADPNSNLSNPNMNPNLPGAFANPANQNLNPSVPGSAANPANPNFNPVNPGAQNNPANPQFNPAVPGSTNNSANPELNPNYPGSMTNPSNPIHNPDWPNPEGVPQRPMQARTWEPKQSWIFEPEVGYEVPDVGDELAGSVVSEMDNLSVHLEDGRGMAADQAQALREACLRLASALEPAVDNDGMTKRAWNPFKYTPEPAQSPQEAAQGRMCLFHPERPAVAAEGFAPMCEECYGRYQQAQRGEQYQEPQVEQVTPTNSEWQGLYDQARGWEPREATGKLADYYHQAPTVERERIRQHGLQPANPSLNERWRGGPVGGQMGVYVEEGYPWNDDGLDPHELRQESQWDGGDHANWDVWRIPHDQVHEVQADPRGGETARVIMHPVDAELYQGGPETYGWPAKQAADIPGFEMGDSHQHADPTEPRSSEPPAPPLCTCAEGHKLDCPVHGMHATDPENDDLWGRWHIPQSNPVGYPAGQPRGWSTPYQS